MDITTEVVETFENTFEKGNLIDTFSQVGDEQSRVNAQVRHANHTALADSLMDFKQNRDLEQLFAKYGTPLIKRTGSSDPKASNVDIYIQ